MHKAHVLMMAAVLTVLAAVDPAAAAEPLCEHGCELPWPGN